MSSVGIFQLREIPIGDLERDATHHIKVMVSKIQYLLTLSYKKRDEKHNRNDVKSFIISTLMLALSQLSKVET